MVTKIRRKFKGTQRKVYVWSLACGAIKLRFLFKIKSPQSVYLNNNNFTKNDNEKPNIMKFMLVITLF